MRCERSVFPIILLPNKKAATNEIVRFMHTSCFQSFYFLIRKQHECELVHQFLQTGFQSFYFLIRKQPISIRKLAADDRSFPIILLPNKKAARKSKQSYFEPSCFQSFYFLIRKQPLSSFALTLTGARFQSFYFLIRKQQFFIHNH